ncbi:hypothetical protein ACPCSQ_16670 [Streptomyces griseoincarnatus]|uniref:hypothetical protein n=1 Tax=unclassified Streptomyces TaxID=2593676 RepID=UPI000C880262|nr:MULTISPECIES: hypothetical protein [unclassified Streptomyces]MBJ6644414.1 hypothetical protein [Streptomyces sp. BSE7-9]MCA2199989.1 hypothetical protein [Streptomyces sp. SMS_SU21]NEA96264.1 hypothetical protein [Actinospica acidiphila]
MVMAAWKRAGVCLTAAAVVVGLAGCQDGDDGGSKKAGASAEAQTREEAAEVLQAAFKKTSEAKSSKIRMTVQTSGTAAESGTMEMSGVQGWDPAVMDVTMKGSGFAAAGPGTPEQMRMIMLDGVMYVDMGTEQAAEMDGKRWMKMDFKALADASGDPEVQKQMTGGLENMNQDPAQQLALLLESSSLKHVGPEKVDGVEAQHYKGTLSFKEMMDANTSFDLLSKEERDELVATAEKSGMKGYDTEIWVNEDDLPVKMVVGMTMAQGTMKMTSHFSDYGAKAEVEAPPAGETLDFMQMLKDLESLGAGSAA